MLNPNLRVRWILAFLSLSLFLTLAAAEEKSRTDSGWMGILLGKPGDEMSALDDAEGRTGVPVRMIVEDGPAARAGLRARDSILTVNGTAVENANELLEQLRREAPGNWIPMTIQRNGQERDVRIRLGERPAEPRKLKLRRGRIGVEAIELPPALREHFGAPVEAGVMIASVVEGGPAEAAGFRLGDVVYEIEGSPVRSVGELSRRVAGGGVGNTLEFKVARSGAEMILEATLDSPPVPDTR